MHDSMEDVEMYSPMEDVRMHDMEDVIEKQSKMEIDGKKQSDFISILI